MEHDETKQTETKQTDLPVALQVVSILIAIGGAFYFVIGIPLLLFFGFGIIPMIVGGMLIFYATKIYALKKNAYVGTLVLGVLSALDALRTHSLVHFAIPLVLVGIIYAYRERFVNA